MEQVKNEKTFFEVFPTLRADGELKMLFQDVEVKKITTNSTREFLHIHMVSHHLIPKKVIWKMEQSIKEQLASHLKLTRSTIAGYETKGKQPDYERLLQIADYFHVSVDYLLTGSETNGISVPPDSSEYRLLCAYLNLSSDSRQQLFEYTEFLQDQDTKKGRMPK